MALTNGCRYETAPEAVEARRLSSIGCDYLTRSSLPCSRTTSGLPARCGSLGGSGVGFFVVPGAPSRDGTVSDGLRSVMVSSVDETGEGGGSPKKHRALAVPCIAGARMRRRYCASVSLPLALLQVRQALRQLDRSQKSGSVGPLGGVAWSTLVAGSMRPRSPQ